MGHVSFWGKADIDRRPDLIGFDAFDPKRTKTGLKSRSAALRASVCAIVQVAGQEGSAAPHLDSEQFRSAPRTCRSLCGTLSVR
jgi:hypothetical protein